MDEDAAMRKALQAAQQNHSSQTRPQTITNLTAQVSQKEKPYAAMEFPSTEYRLLALFRYWNIVNYFFHINT
jgi:hypothetical protein